MEYFVQAQEYVRSLEERLHTLETLSREKDLQLAQLKQGASPAAPRLAKDIPVEEMLTLLLTLNAKLSSSEVLSHAKALCDKIAAEEQASANEDVITRNKLQSVNQYVAEVQRVFWEEKRVEDGLEYFHPHSPARMMEEYQDALDEFQEIEERVVVVSALGQNVYDRNKKEEAELNRLEEEMSLVMDGTDMAAKQALVTRVRTEANQVFQSKLNKATSQRDMMRIFETLSEQERTSMFRAEVLQRMMSSHQSHGHSHGGEPCHGHGEPQKQEHGHSHNGEPCHGHGEPAHGHSHDHHGHSHNEDEEEDCCSEDDEDDEEVGHGHSHDGKSCHGHSH